MTKKKNSFNGSVHANIIPGDHLLYGDDYDDIMVVVTDDTVVSFVSWLSGTFALDTNKHQIHHLLFENK